MKRSKNPLHARAAAIAAVAALIAPGLSLAQQARVAASRTQPPAKSGGIVRIKSGEVGSYKETPAGAIVTITGNVVLEYEGTASDNATLSTDVATYNRTTQVANSPGKLQIDDAQNTLIGDHGTAYYRTKKALIRGNVRILARPRPQNQNAPEGSLRREFKDPVTITCDQVDYNWRTRVAVVTGDLTLRQKDRTVTADRAVYEGKAERITLIGNVRGIRSQGDEIRGEKAVVILKEGAESLTLTGIKGGSFIVEDETEAAPAAPILDAIPGSAPTPPPAPTTPPGARR